MTSQEQLLKNYILIEIYNIEKNNYNLFLERKELLEEGKIWDWSKKAFNTIKNKFHSDPSTRDGLIKLRDIALKKGNKTSADRYQRLIDSLDNKISRNQNCDIIKIVASYLTLI